MQRSEARCLKSEDRRQRSEGKNAGIEELRN